MQVLRTREGGEPRTDTRRLYRYSGFLRGRVLALTWSAEDRPDTFGTMALALDGDCRVMHGLTVHVPPDARAPVERAVWFKRAG
jgi:hypothetical protein